MHINVFTWVTTWVFCVSVRHFIVSAFMCSFFIWFNLSFLLHTFQSQKHIALSDEEICNLKRKVIVIIYSQFIRRLLCAICSVVTILHLHHTKYPKPDIEDHFQKPFL